MKYFVIFVILIASAYAAEQQTIADKPTPNPIYELANMNFQLGIAYQQAMQNQNVAIFNSLVDQYNAWVREKFSEGADALLMSKINVTDLLGISQKQHQQVITGTNKTGTDKEIAHIYEENPFNASSELSKFGKHQVMLDLGPGGATNIETANTERMLENF
jgi:hypothetical protein